MATKLPSVDAVLIGFGWTGAIMAQDKSASGTLDDDFATRLVDGLLQGLSARS